MLGWFHVCNEHLQIIALMVLIYYYYQELTPMLCRSVHIVLFSPPNNHTSACCAPGEALSMLYTLGNTRCAHIHWKH